MIVIRHVDTRVVVVSFTPQEIVKLDPIVRELPVKFCNHYHAGSWDRFYMERKHVGAWVEFWREKFDVMMGRRREQVYTIRRMISVAYKNRHWIGFKEEMLAEMGPFIGCGMEVFKAEGRASKFWRLLRTLKTVGEFVRENKEDSWFSNESAKEYLDALKWLESPGKVFQSLVQRKLKLSEGFLLKKALLMQALAEERGVSLGVVEKILKREKQVGMPHQVRDPLERVHANRAYIRAAVPIGTRPERFIEWAVPEPIR